MLLYYCYWLVNRGVKLCTEISGLLNKTHGLLGRSFALDLRVLEFIPSKCSFKQNFYPTRRLIAQADSVNNLSVLIVLTSERTLWPAANLCIASPMFTPITTNNHPVESQSGVGALGPDHAVLWVGDVYVYTCFLLKSHRAVARTYWTVYGLFDVVSAIDCLLRFLCVK